MLSTKHFVASSFDLVDLLHFNFSFVVEIENFRSIFVDSLGRFAAIPTVVAKMLQKLEGLEGF